MRINTLRVGCLLRGAVYGSTGESMNPGYGSRTPQSVVTNAVLIPEKSIATRRQLAAFNNGYQAAKD